MNDWPYGIDAQKKGVEIHFLIKRLFPYCRSITGDGVRRTLKVLSEYCPLQIREVPTGTQVFDWTIPQEWNIRDAYIKDPQGRKIVDFQTNCLHVLNYSVPFRGVLSLKELREHLYSLPDYPDRIPYLTSYYAPKWGFCLSHEQLIGLQDGLYEVCIDSTLEEGSLTYGEFLIPGSSKEEVLLSSYICHPSMANDSLSGVAMLAVLGRELSVMDLRYSYRFLFVPETIGAITWLAFNEERAGHIKHGLVATCLGDRGRMIYKKSRRGDAVIDRAVTKVLEDSGEPFQEVDFFPTGSDERQFCSPGFNLPVGSLVRTMYGDFSEYHTSADDLDFVCAESLGDSLVKYARVIDILEHDDRYLNLNPKCEPQLGRRGLYALLGSGKEPVEDHMVLLWILNLSDGEHSVLDISRRSRLPFPKIRKGVDILVQAGLLRKI